MYYRLIICSRTVYLFESTNLKNYFVFHSRVATGNLVLRDSVPHTLWGTECHVPLLRNRYVVSGGTQRRALPRHQCEEMKILNILYHTSFWYWKKYFCVRYSIYRFDPLNRRSQLSHTHKICDKSNLYIHLLTIPIITIAHGDEVTDTS